MKTLLLPLIAALALVSGHGVGAQLTVGPVKLPANPAIQAVPAPAGQPVPAPAVQPIQAPASPAMPTPAAVLPAAPSAIDPQQLELSRLNAEARSLAGQIGTKLQEVRAAQQAQWRGSRSCQGALVVWNRPAQGEGGGFPLPAYDCSPYQCEAPGLCMAQCSTSAQCALGAHCIKTAAGGVCAPAR